MNDAIEELEIIVHGANGLLVREKRYTLSGDYQSANEVADKAANIQIAINLLKAFDGLKYLSVK